MTTQRTINDDQARAAHVAINLLYTLTGRWIDVAETLEVHPADLSRLNNNGYCSPALYKALARNGHVDAPATKEYQACGCGDFHPMRPCPKKRRKRGPRRNMMIPIDDIEAAIAKMEQVYGVKLKLSGGAGD